MSKKVKETQLKTEPIVAPDLSDKPKRKTDTELLVFAISTLVRDLKLSESDVKKSLSKVSASLPRTFPETYGGKRKEHKPVLADKPKVSKNAYLFFGEEIRNKLKSEIEGITPKQIMERTGELWKSISESEKAKYVAKAEEDKKRYQQELDVFKAKHPELFQKIDCRPIKYTAHRAYCEVARAALKTANPKSSGKEIAKMLSDQWKAIKDSPEKVKEYQDTADVKNKGFEDRLSEFNSKSKGGETCKETCKEAEVSKEKKPSKKKAEEKPKVEEKPKEVKVEEKPKGEEVKRHRKVKKPVEENDDDLLNE